MISQRGYELTEGFLAACNVPSKLYIQVNTLKVELKDYMRALDRMEISYETDEKISGCIMLDGGKVTSLPGFDEGLFYVQDKAARMAVELAAPVAMDTVFDACAAPGGKSFSAAVRMQGKGSILCGDIHEKKLARISNGAKRLGVDIIDTRCGDARVFDKELSENFDVVLADVPCSGFGVAGKKPEIRLKKEQDIHSLPEIQRDIVNNVSRYVKPGGTLLYSTCTVLVEGNEDVVESFLKENRQFELDGDMHTFFPNIDGTDGFFVARLKRVR